MTELLIDVAPLKPRLGDTDIEPALLPVADATIALFAGGVGVALFTEEDTTPAQTPKAD